MHALSAVGTLIVLFHVTATSLRRAEKLCGTNITSGTWSSITLSDACPAQELHFYTLTLLPMQISTPLPTELHATNPFQLSFHPFHAKPSGIYWFNPCPNCSLMPTNPTVHPKKTILKGEKSISFTDQP